MAPESCLLRKERAPSRWGFLGAKQTCRSPLRHGRTVNRVKLPQVPCSGEGISARLLLFVAPPLLLSTAARVQVACSWLFSEEPAERGGSEGGGEAFLVPAGTNGPDSVFFFSSLFSLVTFLSRSPLLDLPLSSHSLLCVCGIQGPHAESQGELQAVLVTGSTWFVSGGVPGLAQRHLRESTWFVCEVFSASFPCA